MQAGRIVKHIDQQAISKTHDYQKIVVDGKREQQKEIQIRETKGEPKDAKLEKEDLEHK